MPPCMKLNTMSLKLDVFEVYLFSELKSLIDPEPISSFLSAEEATMLSGRTHQNKRKEFIISRYLIKQALGFSPENFNLLTVRYSPEHNSVIVSKEKELISYLSLSHSGNFIAFVFSNTVNQVGLDIEVIKERDFESLSNTAYSSDDIRLLANSNEKKKAFYQLWTSKEAVAKLTGEDLTQVLKQSDYKLQKSYNLSFLCNAEYAITLATVFRSKVTK